MLQGQSPLSAHLDGYVAAPGPVKFSSGRPLSEDRSIKATDDTVPMNDRRKRVSGSHSGSNRARAENETWFCRCAAVDDRLPTLGSWLVGRPSRVFPPHQTPPHNRIRLMGFMVGQINGEAVFPFKIRKLRGLSGSP